VRALNVRFNAKNVLVAMDCEEAAHDEKQLGKSRALPCMQVDLKVMKGGNLLDYIREDH
jgi:hypothetical protein